MGISVAEVRCGGSYVLGRPFSFAIPETKSRDRNRPKRQTDDRRQQVVLRIRANSSQREDKHDCVTGQTKYNLQQKLNDHFQHRVLPQIGFDAFENELLRVGKLPLSRCRFCSSHWFRCARSNLAFQDRKIGQVLWTSGGFLGIHQMGIAEVIRGGVAKLGGHAILPGCLKTWAAGNFAEQVDPHWGNTKLQNQLGTQQACELNAQRCSAKERTQCFERSPGIGRSSIQEDITVFGGSRCGVIGECVTADDQVSHSMGI